ncbi:hypothetical protein PIB30_014107 [Stylosanthes scabra]|uniref:Aminotransferase-like plant mobile domain-containing protein n=1 Tax=Stylosanthes scabra TaxID=79078 RepID=A0ABU6S633_9FABA|nr:hypothetical protein [Stylosanthes scabra]
MCRAMSHEHCNLSGCMALLLSWAYYHVLVVRPRGFVGRMFLLVSRWTGYKQCNDSLETRLGHWRQVLNNLGPNMARFFETWDTWRSLDGFQHIPRASLMLDAMHNLDGRLRREE